MGGGGSHRMWELPEAIGTGGTRSHIRVRFKVERNNEGAVMISIRAQFLKCHREDKEQTIPSMGSGGIHRTSGLMEAFGPGGQGSILRCTIDVGSSFPRLFIKSSLDDFI